MYSWVDHIIQIPPHGRWRHFDVDKPRLQPLIDAWTASGVDKVEIARRVVELALVSVLLDAGAGPTWRYTEPSTGKAYGRSEGLAVASLDMYAEGFFSGRLKNDPWRVDAEGLGRASERNVGSAMQVGAENPMEGLTGRSALLSNLSLALQSGKEYFGDDARAGNLVGESDSPISEMDTYVLPNLKTSFRMSSRMVTFTSSHSGLLSWRVS